MYGCYERFRVFIGRCETFSQALQIFEHQIYWSMSMWK
jgi:hypothetical protein